VFALNRDTFKATLSNDVQASSNEITEVIFFSEGCRTARSDVYVLAGWSHQALRKVPIFKEYLRLDEVQRVADVLEVVKYPAGSQIIKKGDKGTTFYIIKEGKGVYTEFRLKLSVNPHAPCFSLTQFSALRLGVGSLQFPTWSWSLGVTSVSGL
jgi:hypothetical protein